MGRIWPILLPITASLWIKLKLAQTLMVSPRTNPVNPLALDYDYNGGRKEIHFFLCHDPEKALMTREWSDFHSRLVKEKEEEDEDEENRDSYWVLHGHHHNSYPRTLPFINGEMRRCNVSVELIEYTPLDLDYLCNLIFDRKVIWMQSLDSEPVYATITAQIMWE
jgi:hypothetical protein